MNLTEFAGAKEANKLEFTKHKSFVGGSPTGKIYIVKGGTHGWKSYKEKAREDYQKLLS